MIVTLIVSFFSFQMFDRLRTSELRCELAELAIKGKVSKADHGCISSMLLSKMSKHDYEEYFLNLLQRMDAAIGDSHSNVDNHIELDDMLRAQQEVHRLSAKHQASKVQSNYFEAKFKNERIDHLSSEKMYIESIVVSKEQVAIEKDSNIREPQDQLRNVHKLEEAAVDQRISKILVEEKKRQMDEFVENERLHMEKLHSAIRDIAEEKDFIIFELKEKISCIKSSRDEMANTVELEKQCMSKANNEVLIAMEKEHAAEKEQLLTEVEELRNELSDVKASGEELAKAKQSLEVETKSVRMSYNAVLSALEETYEKDREQQERMIQELSNELSKVKESNTDFILNIQNLELDKESARISNDAIISAVEGTYEKFREQQERMVQELSNELSKVKESNTELILKIEELELGKESARISSDAIMSAMETTYEKDCEQQDRIVQELSNEVSSVKESNKELILKIEELRNLIKRVQE